MKELTLQEINQYSVAIVRSGFCGFTKPEEVVTLALIAQDEGRSIGSVARDYHIIKGRPTLKADAMLARYQSAGGKIEWTELSNERCAAVFTHESSGTFSLDWTIEQAKAAGLPEKNANWYKFPRAMLRARVISEGIRTSLPAVICGQYTPEEVEDMDDGVTLHTPIKAPSAATAQNPAVAQAKDADIVDSPFNKFFNRLCAMADENPEACKYVKGEMAKRGWLKPAQVPASEYEQVYLWYETAKTLSPLSPEGIAVEEEAEEAATDSSIAPAEATTEN